MNIARPVRPRVAVAGVLYRDFYLVDYREKPENVIRRGEYLYVGNGLTGERFPSIKSGVCKIEGALFTFGSFTFPSLNEALEALMADGWIPAELLELLAMAQRYPEIGRRHFVLASGSLRQFEGIELPAISKWYDGRRIDVVVVPTSRYCIPEHRWFAAVRGR